MKDRFCLDCYYVEVPDDDKEERCPNCGGYTAQYIRS